MKVKKLAQMIAMIGVAGAAAAQTAPADQSMARVEITGSSIKRIAKEGALPLEIITRKQIEAQGIVTAEQLVATLSVNGTGSDNLASNADVTSGAQRGNNGASSANLRGQGSDSTLVLLNGRRVATHGMKGAAVDLNSIPMAAVERVEVLKDGASAIYGTDAVGGVINFILRKDYSGLEAQAFTDMTQKGGGDIERVSITGGRGNLDTDGYNVLFAMAHSENKALRGDQRDFVNTFQPNRGVSVDTRGTPYATIFATSLAKTLLSTTSAGVQLPGGGQVYNGVNVLNLPGGAGCGSIPGMAPYDAVLWDTPSAKYGCAWDTGRAAVLQQPVDSDNYVVRGTTKMGENHTAWAELIGSQTQVSKSFSPNQISPGSNFPATSFYPATGAAYNDIYNALVAVFPSVAANKGLPIAYRWRCMPCGNRQIDTKTTAGRLAIGADGTFNLGKTWDYRVGLSSAYSESESKLGSGYNYTVALANALGTGIINPFLGAGQQQSQAAIDLIKSTSAAGVTLYGGRTQVTELDGTVSGELMQLPAGSLQGALGMDLRRESYRFNGDLRDALTRPAILNAPFDDQNALMPVSRDIKAVFFELAIPVIRNLELTVAGRHDQYTGFGGTFNPKVSFRWNPTQQLLFRGSYNSAFRVPAFNQLFNGVTESIYAGKDLADPGTCPTLKVDATKPGCQAITPNIRTGGKSTLGPETAKEGSLGVVFEPVAGYSVSADYWVIRRYDQIKSIDLSTMLANYNLFKDEFIRDGAGNLVAIDQRWVNAGKSVTAGIELSARGGGRIGNGRWTAGLDGTRLLEKKSKTLNTANWGPSELGVFTFTGDLGLKWKHSAFVSYQEGDWSGMFQNIYRGSYLDQVLPGVANGKVTPPDWNPKVKAYSIFNVSVTYSGIKNLSLTGGVKNIFNTDPPFAITYDSNTGAGSSWEPRVADPRGRSFTLTANYKFL
ncbi:MAG: TonB-dependent receptor domain-containing protein [Telluria sp.]